LLSLGACGKHPLPEHTSEPRSHTYVFGDRVGFGFGGDSARFRRYGWAKTEAHSTRTRPAAARSISTWSTPTGLLRCE
jgi:hypothetical protein